MAADLSPQSHSCTCHHVCFFWEPNLHCLCQLLICWHLATNTSSLLSFVTLGLRQMHISALPTSSFLAPAKRGCWRCPRPWRDGERLDLFLACSCSRLTHPVTLSFHLEQVFPWQHCWQFWAWYFFFVGRACCLLCCGAFNSTPALYLLKSSSDD